LQELLESPSGSEQVEQAGSDSAERRAAAAEIDQLVERLRYCSSKEEREEMLKQLKQRILEMQARRKSCA